MYFHLWISAEDRRFFRIMMSSSVKPEMSNEGSAGTYMSGDISDCLFAADCESGACALEGVGVGAGTRKEADAEVGRLNCLAEPVCFCNPDLFFGLTILPMPAEPAKEPAENVAEHAEEGAETGVDIADDERDGKGATKGSLSLSLSWSWRLSGSSGLLLGGRGWNAGLRMGKTVVLQSGGVVAVELKDEFALELYAEIGECEWERE